MRALLKGSPAKVAAEWDDRVEFGNHASNLDFLSRVPFPDAPARVLEIGSGKGRMLEHLMASGYEAVGLDINRSLLAESRTRVPGASVCAASGDALPFDASAFEVVVSFDVFEHIPDTGRHLREVRRVLTPGGSYVLQTPNKWTNMLFEPIRFTQKFGIRHAFRFLEDHCSLHSYRELRQALRRVGFRVDFRDVPVVNAFFKGKVRRYLGRPALAALRVVNPDRAPRFLRTNFHVVATKAHEEPPAGPRSSPPEVSP